MSTSILAIGNTAATSSTVTVAAGAPVTIGLFTASSGPIPYLPSPILCDIADPSVNWAQTGVILDSLNTTVLLIAPGDYRFRRPNYSAATPPGASVGIFRS